MDVSYRVICCDEVLSRGVAQQADCAPTVDAPPINSTAPAIIGAKLTIPFADLTIRPPRMVLDEVFNMGVYFFYDFRL